MERRIHNRIRCAHCDTVIESRAGYDFRKHSCEAMRAVRGEDAYIACDGGPDPGARRVGDPRDWFEASITDPPADAEFEAAARAARIRAVEEPGVIEVEQLAALVLGSRAAAEEWLAKRQLGLDGQRPRDLLATATGTQLVTDLLLRMEAGIYS
jgi:hypothetical protein